MAFITTIPHIGSIGPDVVTLQQQLVYMGLDPGYVDGVFGNKTLAAISKLQKAHDLSGTGLIGPKTLAYLGLSVNEASPVTLKSTITRDLAGKKDRHIHPAMRILLEAQLFPAGGVSKAWLTKDIPACFIEAASALARVGVFEDGGNNMGELVGEVQSTIGSYTPGGNGDSWCLEYAQVIIAVIEDYFGIESPVPAVKSCVDCWEKASVMSGMTTQDPTAGSLALGRHGNTWQGHAMPVVALLPDGKMRTSEGNTSISNMTDGDGSGIKVRAQKKNGDLVTMGFVFVYPDNKLP